MRLGHEVQALLRRGLTPRQRRLPSALTDAVRATHLHLLGRNVPHAAIEIQLCPFGLSKFTGAHKETC